MAAQMSKWISVKERLPKESSNILLFDGTEVFAGTYNIGERRDGSQYAFFGIQGCDGICYGNFERQEFISHWMPLPESPK